MNDEEEKKEAERKAAEEAEAKKKAQPVDDAKDRDPPKAEDPKKSPSMVDAALLAAGELEKQNDRKEVLLKREEELESKKILAGRGEAGQPAGPERTPEEKASRARIKAVADASGASWGKKYE